MKSNFIYLVFLFSVLSVAITATPAKGQNPFTSKKGADKSATEYDSSRTLLFRLNAMQNQAREKIASLVAESRESRSLRPISALILFALLYGILHAAGPGHGKAVAVSYVLSERPSYLKGLALSNLIALFHGAGGIVFVMVVYSVLKTGVAKSMAAVNHITQIVSYSMIICLGLYLLTEAFLEWRKTKHDSLKEDHGTEAGKNIAAALSIGFIPCPGVIMVTFLAVSMGLPGLGILLGVCIALGMAITISIVVIAGITGKRALVNRLESRPRWAQRVEMTIRFLSGLLVTTLGILMLASLNAL